MADDIQIQIGVALEGLQSGLEKAGDILKDFATALGVAFSVEAVKSLVESMAELATQTQRTADILGVGVAQVQELGFLATVTGGSAAALTTSLERMSVGLERGQIASSQQGRAFQALGISVSQLMALSPDKQMLLIADAVKRLSDQGINAAPALSMINRQLAGMMPVLKLGSQGILEMEQRLKNVGGVVTPEVNKKLEELDTKIDLTKAAFTGLGKVLVSEVAGSFDKVSDAITKVIGRLSLLSQTGNLSNYFSTLFTKLVEQMKMVGPEGMGGVTGGGEVQDQVRKVAEDTHAALAKIINAALGQFDDAIKSAGTKAVRVPPGPNSQGIAAADAEYKTAEANLKSLLDTYTITELQMTQALIAQIQIREAKEIAAGEDVKRAQAKAAEETARVNQQLTAKLVASWTQMANVISGAFNSQLKSLLSGQESFGQAMKAAFADMVESMIAKLIELVVQYAVLNAAAATFNVLTGGSIAGPTLGGLFGKLLGLAEGTPYVTQSGLAMIHRGEAVVPAQANPWGGGGGGVTNNMGGNISLNISAIDGRSVANMLLGNKNVLNQVLQQIARSNPGAITRIAGVA